MIKPRENINTLKAYEIHDVPCKIKLDANEGKNRFLKDLSKDALFFQTLHLNLYPDHNATILKKEMSDYYNIDASNIVVGNGSSELIELLIKTFVDPKERIVSFDPSFSMYQVYSQIYDVEVVGVEAKKDFRLCVEDMIQAIKDFKPKLTFICNPNNPTGAYIDPLDIEKIIKSTDSLVVVDEAYMEFSKGSMISKIGEYKNLLVLRTLSKAFGLAGARVGAMMAQKEVIDIIKKVESPYHLNTLSQYIGAIALRNREKLQNYIEEVKAQRNDVSKSLKNLGFLVYPSEANFIFFKSFIKDLSLKLQDKGILIRKFSGKLKEYYRVSIGEAWENQRLILAIEEIIQDEKS